MRVEEFLRAYRRFRIQIPHFSLIQYSSGKVCILCILSISILSAVKGSLVYKALFSFVYFAYFVYSEIFSIFCSKKVCIPENGLCIPENRLCIPDFFMFNSKNRMFFRSNQNAFSVQTQTLLFYDKHVVCRMVLLPLGTWNIPNLLESEA